MKRTLLVLSMLIIGASVNAQKPDQNKPKGKWIAQQGDNNNIVLDFTDSNRLYFSFGNKAKWKGNYNYTTEISNTSFVITIRSIDTTRKDSFQIMLVRNSEEEYKLVNILHLYDDGRPPESELLESSTYILKRLNHN
jgi:hypothetical protein